MVRGRKGCTGVPDHLLFLFGGYSQFQDSHIRTLPQPACVMSGRTAHLYWLPGAHHPPTATTGPGNRPVSAISGNSSGYRSLTPSARKGGSEGQFPLEISLPIHITNINLQFDDISSSNRSMTIQRDGQKG